MSVNDHNEWRMHGCCCGIRVHVRRHVRIRVVVVRSYYVRKLQPRKKPALAGIWMIIGVNDHGVMPNIVIGIIVIIGYEFVNERRSVVHVVEIFVSTRVLG